MKNVEITDETAIDVKCNVIAISNYLPYRLKVLSGDAKEVYELSGITFRDGWVNYERRIEISGENSPRYYTQEIKYCKPILKLLSNAKDILIECAKIEFNPININNFNTGDTYYFHEFIAIDFTHNNDSYQFMYSTRKNCFLFRNITTGIPFTICLENRKMLEIFLKNHVDINELIKKNLAIDCDSL